MSFIDIATLTVHRQHEMEERTNVFLDKCDNAISDIHKLKVMAQGFSTKLNCEPSELKDIFLKYMRKLDEYSCLITEFNIALSMLLDNTDTIECLPVQDKSTKAILPAPSNNLMDMLSDNSPMKSKNCLTCQAEIQKQKKVPKEEQTLIAFSSTSNSDESVNLKLDVLKKEVEVQCELIEENKKDVNDASTSPIIVPCNLPGQCLLQNEESYDATILTIDGATFWIVTDFEFENIRNMMIEMNAYYKSYTIELSVDDLDNMTYCAYFERDSYVRGMLIGPTENPDTLEVFLVDMGLVRCVPTKNIRPLVEQFCLKPPCARCCHLAGIDLNNTSTDNNNDLEEFMKRYVGTQCTIVVDENTSESIGVFVTLPSGEILNDLLVKSGLALSIDLPVQEVKHQSAQGPPEIAEGDLDISSCPEYEDPLEAVTGYHNRDEEEICKHYKGGSEKTCFKGARCKKRHVKLHPDGWTLDKVEVIGRMQSLPLPAPDTWCKVHVTYVCHFDRVYLQLQSEEDTEEPVTRFGVILPPKTLKGLLHDMNSPASQLLYKPLQLAPAPGEMVAALYPLDGNWYRARVLTSSRADKSVEVLYVDYGNSIWVKEDSVRKLPPQYANLPAQAVRCRLAGVVARSYDSQQWANAKEALSQMAQDRTLDAHIIARDFDEMTIELYDQQGYSIGEQLAARNLVNLKPFTVENDTTTRHKIVVP